MQRDFKIGMLLGLVIIAIGSFFLVFQSYPPYLPSVVSSPSLGTLGRRARVNPQTISDLPNSPSKIDLSERTRWGGAQRSTVRDNNQHSTINYQTTKPTFIAFESRPALGGVKNPKIHILSYGETLSAISAKYYGSTNKWKKIFDANRSQLKDANKLTPGIKLIIPE